MRITYAGRVPAASWRWGKKKAPFGHAHGIIAVQLAIGVNETSLTQPYLVQVWSKRRGG